MGHKHQDGGPTCDLPTKKACDDRYADWQAMQQVILAYNIAGSGDTRAYRKEKSVLARLVLYISGESHDILNDEGNPNLSPWVVRIRRAIERFAAGDLPGYNLYEPVVPATAQEA